MSWQAVSELLGRRASLRRAAPRIASAVIAVLAATGCRPPQDAIPLPTAPRAGAAGIRVEIYGGFEGGAAVPPPSHLIVDVTPLLGSAEPPAANADLTPLAKELAEGLLAPLPGEASPSLHPFHRMAPRPQATTCPIRGAKTQASDLIGELRRGVLSGEAARGSQVILALDFTEECTPLLCQRATELASAGVWIDVIQVGRGEPPSCLESLPEIPAVEPPGLREGATRAPRMFRVEQLRPDGSTTRILANGRAGATVSVDPGVHIVVLEGQPDIVIGPFELGVGQVARVRVLDFPMSAPEARSWTVEVINGAS